MLRHSSVLLALSATPVAAAEPCPVGELYDLAHGSLEEMKPISIDASQEVTSTEGAEWRIYREKDGRVHTIMLDIYGESGKRLYRLSIRNRAQYVISDTQTSYNAHLSGATAKEIVDYYYFCEGKAYVPTGDMAFVGEDYTKAATEAKALIFGSKSAGEFTKGLK